MKRVIVDYNKLNDHILELLTTMYPEGYSDDDIISFYNAQKERVECVEVRTEDTIYLVKISRKLVIAMDEYIADQEDDNEGDDYDFEHEEDKLTNDIEQL